MYTSLIFSATSFFSFLSTTTAHTHARAHIHARTHTHTKVVTIDKVILRATATAAASRGQPSPREEAAGVLPMPRIGRHK